MDALKELEVTIHRDFATKRELSRIDEEVRTLAEGHIALKTTLESINTEIKKISSNINTFLTHVARTAITFFVTALLIAGAYGVGLQMGWF